MSEDKEKNVEDRFKKLSHKEHILLRPDSYIGAKEVAVTDMWILN